MRSFNLVFYVKRAHCCSSQCTRNMMNLQAFVVPDRRRSPLVAQQRTQEASTKSRPGLLKAKRWTNHGRSINAAFPPPATMFPSLSRVDHRRRLALLLSYAANHLLEPPRRRTTRSVLLPALLQGKLSLSEVFKICCFRCYGCCRSQRTSLPRSAVHIHGDDEGCRQRLIGWGV